MSSAAASLILLAGFAASEAEATTVLRTSGLWTPYNQPNADVTITGGPQFSQAHIRRANQLSYLADLTIGTLAYPDVIELEGNITVTDIDPNFDGDIEFGYFDAPSGALQWGIALTADTATSMSMWLVTGGARFPLSRKVNLNEPLNWYMTYYPGGLDQTWIYYPGGSAGVGTTPNVYGRTAFGWRVPGLGTGSAIGYVDLVISDVKYTVGSDAPPLPEVPEPGAAGVAAATLLAAFLLLRSRRSVAV